MVHTRHLLLQYLLYKNDPLVNVATQWVFTLVICMGQGHWQAHLRGKASGLLNQIVTLSLALQQLWSPETEREAQEMHNKCTTMHGKGMTIQTEKHNKILKRWKGTTVATNKWKKWKK